MKEEIKIKYKIIEKIMETEQVFTLKMIPENINKSKANIKYIPGQFINIYFPELETPEGKAYSISSYNNEKTINITVKSMGLFSNRLCSLNTNDTIIGSLPYGYFYSESDNSNIVLIAGGIGIAPFRSMINELLSNNIKRKILLYYSVQKTNEIIYKNEFDSLIKKYKNLKIKYFITREMVKNKSNRKKIERDNGETDIIKYFYRRINIKDIELSNINEYFICGSIKFVADFWKLLKNNNVPEENIYNEAFFSH